MSKGNGRPGDVSFRMLQQLEQINDNLVQLNGRVDRLDERLVELNGRVDHLDERVDRLADKVDLTNARLDLTNSALNRLGVLTRTDDLDQRLNMVEQKVLGGP